MTQQYTITMPEAGPKPSYYKGFGGYLEIIFRQNGASIQKQGTATNCFYEMKLNSKPFIIDFSDFLTIYKEAYQPNIPYFKFHRSPDLHGHLPNIYSFTKKSFYDWSQMNRLQESIQYRCNSDLIINMQRPRGDAVERRIFVREMLKREYGKFVKTDFVKEQLEFWNTINNCLVHVCVPGARNDILDKGHVQALAFGCCTISPKLADGLAWNTELTPGKHYLTCADDYSDLLTVIEWCKKNRDACVEIGKNAKQLFNETSTPKKQWEWLLQCCSK